MKRFKRIVALTTLVAMLGASTSAFAVDENAFRETFTSAFYGVAVGALVGGALMVFTHKPADHLDYIGFGAAAGALAGTAYGVVRSSRSFASIENGSVKIAMPTIIPDLAESPSSKQMIVSFRANILQGTFN
jgi:uncharacterized membrane protein YebE (DUF533 family)